MKVQEIERACEQNQPPDFSRHPLETAVLTLTRLFHPFGFPVEIKTNSEEVLHILGEVWGMFRPLHHVKTIVAEIHVVEGSSEGNSEVCPPQPTYRIMLPYLTSFADADNYTIVDFSSHAIHVCMSKAALANKLYAIHHLPSAVLSSIATQHATPIHSACVSLRGHGILLCGDSGAGKSTLSYACARRGWTYTSDDASYLLHSGKGRCVTGNCYQFRFRPETTTFFPETQGLTQTPRYTGKPSIEVPSARLGELTCSPTAHIESIVFLNRRTEDYPKLVPYNKDVARYVMQDSVYGLPADRPMHYRTIERLLTADVYEMRYRDLDWAIDRLTRLVEEADNGAHAGGR